MPGRRERSPGRHIIFHYWIEWMPPRHFCKRVRAPETPFPRLLPSIFHHFPSSFSSFSIFILFSFYSGPVFPFSTHHYSFSIITPSIISSANPPAAACLSVSSPSSSSPDRGGRGGERIRGGWIDASIIVRRPMPRRARASFQEYFHPVF